MKDTTGFAPNQVPVNEDTAPDSESVERARAQILRRTGRSALLSSQHAREKLSDAAFMAAMQEGLPKDIPLPADWRKREI